MLSLWIHNYCRSLLSIILAISSSIFRIVHAILTSCDIVIRTTNCTLSLSLFSQLSLIMYFSLANRAWMSWRSMKFARLRAINVWNELYIVIGNGWARTRYEFDIEKHLALQLIENRQDYRVWSKRDTENAPINFRYLARKCANLSRNSCRHFTVLFVAKRAEFHIRDRYDAETILKISHDPIAMK